MSFFLQIWREINEKVKFSTMWVCPWLTSNTIGHLVTWWHFIQRSSSFLPNAPGRWPLGHGYLPSLLSELLRQNPRSCDFSAARPLTLRRNGGSRFWDFFRGKVQHCCFFRLGHLGDDHYDRHPDNRHDLLLHGKPRNWSWCWWAVVDAGWWYLGF